MESFDRAQAAIEQIAVSTAGTIGRAGLRSAHPEPVTVEFGLTVSAKGDAVVASVLGDSSLKVTLTYTNHGGSNAKAAHVKNDDAEVGIL